MQDNNNDKMKININNNNNKIIRTKDNNINNLNTSKKQLPTFRITKNIRPLKNTPLLVCFSRDGYQSKTK